MALVDLLVLCWGSLVFLGRFAHVHLFFCVCDMAEGILLGTTQDNNGREAISHCVAIVSRLCGHCVEINCFTRTIKDVSPPWLCQLDHCVGLAVV